MDSEYEESNCSSPRGASLPSSEDAEWKPDPSVPQVKSREGGDIGLFITLVPQAL